jgi:hypothetical protein
VKNALGRARLRDRDVSVLVGVVSEQAYAIWTVMYDNLSLCVFVDVAVFRGHDT